MALKLKDRSNSPVQSFSWDNAPSPPSELSPAPTSWLSARDMRLFGAEPLSSISSSGVGLVKCRECNKPILESCAAEHATTCATARAAAAKRAKSKGETDSRKRKASPSNEEPSKKKSKSTPNKGGGNSRRMKGPLDLDKQCGVINDKGLPCSRSLTCKSHSMGAKRAVEGRSDKYDKLLLDWQRANNPNFVEPVRNKETKAERKAKKEAEKAEKKRLAMEAAAAAGENLPGGGKRVGGQSGGSSKNRRKQAAAAAAAVKLAEEAGEDGPENLDDIDSEAEVDELVKSVKAAKDKKILEVPLAVPTGASSWFIQRRERARCCRDLLLGALASANGPVTSTGIAASLGSHVGLAGRPLTSSMGVTNTARIS